MARLLLVVKYAVFIVVVLSAGVAIERLAKVKHWSKPEPYTSDDLTYDGSSPLISGHFDSGLKKMYLKCLTEPSKSFCLLPTGKRLEIFRSQENESPDVEVIENRLQNITALLHPLKRRIHSLLVTFTRIMDLYDVKILLIEPSMLFCMLPSKRKTAVLTAGFNPGRLQGSRNVVTVGVLEKDSKKLEYDNFTNEMLSSGFKISKFRRWTGDEFRKSFEAVHYLFILQDLAIHAVVFYPRNTYLWHAGLDTKRIGFKELLFANEGLFENVVLHPLDLTGSSMRQIYLPRNIVYFLKEMESSSIVNCEVGSPGAVVHSNHPNLTKEQLDVRAAITLRELKTVLAPPAVIFWLWSETLRGWSEKCDIFSNTSELNFAVTYRSIQGLNISQLLDENEYLKFDDTKNSDSKFGYTLDCRGLLVKLFVMYEDEDQFWYIQGDQETNRYPMFSICSSSLFGQKIHVPCNMADALKFKAVQNRTGTLDSLLNT